jgi:hypothetical protein
VFILSPISIFLVSIRAPVAGRSGPRTARREFRRPGTALSARFLVVLWKWGCFYLFFCNGTLEKTGLLLPSI